MSEFPFRGFLRRYCSTLQGFCLLVISIACVQATTIDGPLAGTMLNSETAGNQHNASAALAPNGAGMVVWEQRPSIGEDAEIFGRLIGANGVPVGNDFQVNDTTEGIQSDPVIVATQEGNFVVVWLGEADRGASFPVLARMYTPNGTALTGEIPVSGAVSALEPSVAAQPGGGFIVAWRGDAVGQNSVQFRLFAADGNARGAAVTAGANLAPQSQPVVTADGQGRFIVLWNSDETVVGRRFSADGQPLSDDLVLESGSSGLFDAAMDETGALAIASVKPGQNSPPSNPSSFGLYLRQLNAAGEGAAYQLLAENGTVFERPHVARTAGGGMFVAWNQGYLTARRFYPSGATMGPDFWLTAVPLDRLGWGQRSWSNCRGVAMDANGGVLAAWSRPDATGEFQANVFAGRLPMPDRPVVIGNPQVTGARTVTLHGMVTPRGEPLTVYCQYGLKGVSETTGTLRITVSGTDPTPVAFPLSDLFARTPYRYRLVGEDSRGLVYSDEGTFKTANTPPRAMDDVLHPMLQQPVIVIDAEWNDYDPDGHGVWIVECTNGEHGTVAISGDRSRLHYTPGANYNGNDTFQYTITDGADTATAIVTLKNAVPAVPDKTMHAPMIGVSSLIFDVAMDAPDADNDAVTVSLGQSPWPGAVSISNGKVYLTSAGVRGAEHVRLNWSDGHGARGTCTVTLTNLEPKAFDCTMVGLEDERDFLLAPYMRHGGDGDGLILESVTQGSFGSVGSVDARVGYQRGPQFEGRDSFTYTISDQRGYTATGTVFVRSDAVEQRVLASRGNVVPGLGEPGESPAKWNTFGIPSFAGTELGWSARVRTAAKTFTGIFAGEPETPRLLLRTGDAVPDGTGVIQERQRFVRFREPVFGGYDSFAVVGTIEGRAVAPSADVGIWARTQGMLEGIALKGAPAPGVAHGVFDAFISVVMNVQNDVFFVASLRTGGPASIGPTNDMGLWRWSRFNGLQLLLREGAEIEVTNGVLNKVAGFDALTLVSGSPGQGRYGSEVATRVRFVDGVEALAACSDGGLRFEAITGDSAFGVIDRFGIPDQFETGDSLVATATVRTGTSTNARWMQTILHTGWEAPLAETGSIEPHGGVRRFTSFRAPVAGTGANGKDVVAFAANTTGGVAKNSGIWSWSDAIGLALVARKGDRAPEANGRVWGRFLSVAILPGYGPMFMGTLAPSATTPLVPETRGLWATDSGGTLRLIAREGGKVQLGDKTKILRKMDVLNAVSGSPGQQRSFGEDPGRIVYRAIFSDGSTAIMRATVP